MLVDKDTPDIHVKQLHIYGTLEVESENSIDHTIKAEVILVSGSMAQLVVGWPDKPYPNNVLIQLVGDHATEDVPISSSLNLGAKALGVFGKLQLYGEPRDIVWTSLSETLDLGQVGYSEF